MISLYSTKLFRAAKKQSFLHHFPVVGVWINNGYTPFICLWYVSTATGLIWSSNVWKLIHLKAWALVLFLCCTLTSDQCKMPLPHRTSGDTSPWVWQASWPDFVSCSCEVAWWHIVENFGILVYYLSVNLCGPWSRCGLQLAHWCYLATFATLMAYCLLSLPFVSSWFVCPQQ